MGVNQDTEHHSLPSASPINNPIKSDPIVLCNNNEWLRAVNIFDELLKTELDDDPIISRELYVFAAEAYYITGHTSKFNSCLQLAGRIKLPVEALARPEVIDIYLHEASLWIQAGDPCQAQDRYQFITLNGSKIVNEHCYEVNERLLKAQASLELIGFAHSLRTEEANEFTEALLLFSKPDSNSNADQILKLLRVGYNGIYRANPNDEDSLVKVAQAIELVVKACLEDQRPSEHVRQLSLLMSECNLLDKHKKILLEHAVTVVQGLDSQEFLDCCAHILQLSRQSKEVGKAGLALRFSGAVIERLSQRSPLLLDEQTRFILTTALVFNSEIKVNLYLREDSSKKVGNSFSRKAGGMMAQLARAESLICLSEAPSEAKEIIFFDLLVSRARLWGIYKQDFEQLLDLQMAAAIYSRHGLYFEVEKETLIWVSKTREDLLKRMDLRNLAKDLICHFPNTSPADQLHISFKNRHILLLSSLYEEWHNLELSITARLTTEKTNPKSTRLEEVYKLYPLAEVTRLLGFSSWDRSSKPNFIIKVQTTLKKEVTRLDEELLKLRVEITGSSEFYIICHHFYQALGMESEREQVRARLQKLYE